MRRGRPDGLARPNRRTMLTDPQFDRTRRLASLLAGIELVERHRELLSRRSRRLGIRDAAGLDTLLGAAEAGDAQARRTFLSLLTTKFTEFFRHPAHFAIAAAHARGVVARAGRARLWSAAAATGEEPYSLAIAIVEAFGNCEPPVEVVATDIDREALAVAERGEYAEAAVRAPGPERRARYFEACGEPGRCRITDTIRRLVTIRPLNLIDAEWPVEGPFDVIFCRNVLMYLEAGRRAEAVRRMASLLAPDGLFMLDPVEDPGATGALFAASAPGVFSRRPAARLRLGCSGAAEGRF
ncbi:MAG: chemotaxis protein CheR [Planctomycetota bacterium]|nr:MAG: chemotaxis protein CheR [Planctomycetota bacterium]